MAVNVQMYTGRVLEFVDRTVNQEIERWEDLGFDVINLEVFSRKSRISVAKIIEKVNPWGCTCDEHGIDELGFECDKCDFHSENKSYEC